MLSACFGDVSYLEQELNQLIHWRSCVSVRFWYPFVHDLMFMRWTTGTQGMTMTDKWRNLDWWPQWKVYLFL